MEQIPEPIRTAITGLIVALLMGASGTIGVLVTLMRSRAKNAAAVDAANTAREAADVQSQTYIREIAEKFEQKYELTNQELAKTREEALSRKAEYNLELGKLQAGQQIYGELNEKLSARVSSLEVQIALKDRDAVTLKEENAKLTDRVNELEQRQRDRHEAINQAQVRVAQTESRLNEVIVERDKMRTERDNAITAALLAENRAAAKQNELDRLNALNSAAPISLEAVQAQISALTGGA